MKTIHGLSLVFSLIVQPQGVSELVTVGDREEILMLHKTNDKSVFFKIKQQIILCRR